MLGRYSNYNTRVLFVWHQCCVRRNRSGVYIQLGKTRIISHKKRSVFYNEVCSNKLFDFHHSDNDRICYMLECKKRDAN